MKSFIKNSASGIIATVIGNVILWVLTIFNDEARAFLLSKSVNNLFLLTVFIILNSVIFNLISRLKDKNKELLQNDKYIKELTDLTVNCAEKKGFKLYKDFAYYKPDEGEIKLYCKSCLEDRKREIVLQKINEVYYDCSSCGKTVRDTELQNSLINKANEDSKRLQNWLGYNGY